MDSPFYCNTANPSLYVEVPLGCYAITTADDTKPILCAFNVVTGIAITVHDKQSHLSGLMYIPPGHSSVESINNLMQHFNLNSDLEIHLMGGIRDIPHSLATYKTVKETFEDLHLKVIEKTHESNFMGRMVGENEYLRHENDATKKSVLGCPEFPTTDVKSFFTQICLDARSGTVHCSSNVEHSKYMNNVATIYSLKAKKYNEDHTFITNKLNAFKNTDVERNEEKEKIIRKLQEPAKLIYYRENEYTDFLCYSLATITVVALTLFVISVFSKDE